jgi:hypothetical protein
VFGSLTVTSGTLNSNGAIKLKSTGSSTARIANSNGTISGNITSERYVANDGWHFTGTVMSGQSLSDWRDDLPGSETQGPMPGVHTPNPGYFTSMIYEYDQNNNDAVPYSSTTTKGWIVPVTSNIDQYKGYRVFIKSGRVLDNTGTYSMNPSAITLNYNGASAYPGWNLVMNPHLSAVNTSGFSWGAGVQQVVVIWNPITNQYEYQGTVGGLTGVTLNSSISPIASGQSFFVKCTSASTLTIPQTAKATIGGTFFRTATDNPQNALEIRFKDENNHVDAALFQFVEGSESGYETSLDATKLMNPELNVYTIVGNEKFAINAMPGTDETMNISLGFTVRNSGTYGFQFDGINLVNGYNKMYLKDNYNGTITEITGNTISFSSESGEFNDRFEIIFTNSLTSVNDLNKNDFVSVYPNPVKTDIITVKVPEKSGSVKILITDAMGRVVSNEVFRSTTIKMNKPSQKGQYFIKVETPKNCVNRTLIVE